MLTQDNEPENKYVAKITPESMARESARLLSYARHNEAAALRHARNEEREKWQKIIADKDAEIANKEAELARLNEQLEKKEMLKYIDSNIWEGNLKEMRTMK